MTDVIWGSTRKPVASQRLATMLEDSFPETGVLYVGYPVLSGGDGVTSVDALWVSPAHGPVIFHLVEGTNADGYKEAQDEFAINLETRLRPHKALMQGRTLLAPPSVVTYAPLAKHGELDPTYPIANDETLIGVLQEITWDRPDLYETVHSVVQSISSIRRGRRRRQVDKPNSRGAYLKLLEDSIANLDSIQGRAVIETVEGVQRCASSNALSRPLDADRLGECTAR